MPLMKEQTLMEKTRVTEAASDKNDEHDYLQPLKTISVEKDSKWLEKSDSRKEKKKAKLFLVDILII